MSEEELRREVKRAKFWNILIFCVFAGILLAAGSCFLQYTYTHTYTPQKWNNDPENRYKIVSSLLNKHPLTGMTESDVIALLGPEEPNAPTSFKITHLSHGEYPPEATLVYYLGVGFMDTEWLVISLEDGVVSEYCIDVT